LQVAKIALVFNYLYLLLADNVRFWQAASFNWYATGSAPWCMRAADSRPTLGVPGRFLLGAFLLRNWRASR
jgi:hypothetical protein